MPHLSGGSKARPWQGGGLAESITPKTGMTGRARLRWRLSALRCWCVCAPRPLEFRGILRVRMCRSSQLDALLHTKQKEPHAVGPDYTGPGTAGNRVAVRRDFAVRFAGVVCCVSGGLAFVHGHCPGIGSAGCSRADYGHRRRAVGRLAGRFAVAGQRAGGGADGDCARFCQQIWPARPRGRSRAGRGRFSLLLGF